MDKKYIYYEYNKEAQAIMTERLSVTGGGMEKRIQCAFKIIRKKSKTKKSMDSEGESQKNGASPILKT